MNVNQVSFTGAQPKQPMSKGKKVAIAAGTVAATAATAAVIAAGVIGGKKAPDAKLLAKLGTGFAEMGNIVAKGAKDGANVVSKKAKGAAKFVGEKAQKAGDAIKEAFAKLQAKFQKTAQHAEEVIVDLEEDFPIGHA